MYAGVWYILWRDHANFLSFVILLKLCAGDIFTLSSGYYEFILPLNFEWWTSPAADNVGLYKLGNKPYIHRVVFSDICLNKSS